MQQSTTKQQKLQAAMKQGWSNFIHSTRPQRPLLRLVPSSSSMPVIPAREPEIDPIALTVLAVNRLGLATQRCVAIGKATTIAVPDLRTAEIFRAALQEMQKNRRTDRLIDIVVTAEPGPGGRGRDAAIEA
jgi:hypothetical protein